MARSAHGSCSLRRKQPDSYGEDYCTNKEYFDDAVARYGDYAKNLGTAIRNHLMMRAMRDGKGPILMQTPAALETISKNMKEKLGEKKAPSRSSTLRQRHGKIFSTWLSDRHPLGGKKY